jgi:hypothetical protein
MGVAEVELGLELPDVLGDSKEEEEDLHVSGGSSSSISFNPNKCLSIPRPVAASLVRLECVWTARLRRGKSVRGCIMNCTREKKNIMSVFASMSARILHPPHVDLSPRHTQLHVPIP